MYGVGDSEHTVHFHRISHRRWWYHVGIRWHVAQGHAIFSFFVVGFALHGEFARSLFFFSFPVMIQQYTILYHIPNHRVEFYWISALSEPALFFFAARATFEVLTDERAFSPASKISVDLFSRLL